MDKLSKVLSYFSVSTNVFYSGKLCGLSVFDKVEEQVGHIHFLRGGRLEIMEQGRTLQVLTAPALLFYPRPIVHTIKAEDSDNTEIVCASVSYGAGPNNPIATSLPAVMCLNLGGEDNRLACAVEWLFEEAFTQSSARQTVMNRLCEILIIQLLRHAMSSSLVESGLLAGLAHPQISRAIDAIHCEPQRGWSLQDLAEVSAMSRSRFSEQFKETIGQTPNDYLTSWRVEMAKNLLRQEKPVGWIASEVGYDSASALARVFRKKVGMSPREWLGTV